MKTRKYRTFLGISALGLNALAPLSTAMAQPDQTPDQPTASDVPYYHTDKTKPCEIGPPGWSWPATYEGKTVLITGTPGPVWGLLFELESTVLFEYPIPKIEGVTGRYGGVIFGADGAHGRQRARLFFGDLNGSGTPNFVSATKVPPDFLYITDDFPSPIQSKAFFYNSGGNQVLSHLGSWAYTWMDDFDGDGFADIASRDGRSVAVYINKLYDRATSGRGFTISSWPVAGNWGQSGYTFTGDFDGNGKADIASAQGSNVFMSLSSGTDFSDATWPAAMRWGAAEYTFGGDFNGDGRDDILSITAGSTSVAFSSGSGFEVSQGKVSNMWGSGDYTWAHDFNNDGKTDIATAIGCQITVKVSDGKGNFVDEPTFLLDLPAGRPKCEWFLSKITAQAKVVEAPSATRPPEQWLYRLPCD